MSGRKRTELTPRRVRAGDVVAVVSPSFGAPAAWPHRAQRGAAYLASLGLRVMFMPHARSRSGWVSASGPERAADLHAAFADPNVSVVLCSIGGNHSNQVLPYLDFDLIAAHPKLFQGYSDITVLHWALHVHAGLRTFYGPALVPELGEYREVLSYTDRWLRAAWFGDGPLHFEPAAEWTDEFLDWNAREDLARPRRRQPGGGWRTLRGGAAEGWLMGGCLETITYHIKGSPAWQDLTGALLFLEISEEVPPPATVDAYLTNLENLGVFDQVEGLVVARPFRYPPDQVERFWEVVHERTARSAIPVLGDVECGHADPMLTLPLGARARIDASAHEFEILVPATMDP